MLFSPPHCVRNGIAHQKDKVVPDGWLDRDGIQNKHWTAEDELHCFGHCRTVIGLAPSWQQLSILQAREITKIILKVKRKQRHTEDYGSDLCLELNYSIPKYYSAGPQYL